MVAAAAILSRDAVMMLGSPFASMLQSHSKTRQKSMQKGRWAAGRERVGRGCRAIISASGADAKFHALRSCMAEPGCYSISIAPPTSG